MSQQETDEQIVERLKREAEPDNPWADVEGADSSSGGLDRDGRELPLSSVRMDPSVWDRTRQLSLIRQAARSQGINPEALLAACLTRLCSLAGPRLKVKGLKNDPVTSGPFVAIIKDAAGGKSTTVNSMDALLPVPDDMKRITDQLESRDLALDQLPDSDYGYRRITPPSGNAYSALHTVNALASKPKDGGERKERQVTVPRVEVIMTEGSLLTSSVDDAVNGGGNTVRLDSMIVQSFFSEAMQVSTKGQEYRTNAEAREYVTTHLIGCQLKEAAKILAATGIGFAHRYLYIPLHTHTASDNALLLAQDILDCAWNKVDDDRLEAIGQEIGEEVRFPGQMTSVRDHAVNLGKTGKVLELPPRGLKMLRVLLHAVAADNGLQHDDELIGHVTIVVLNLMKGLMLLHKRSDITMDDVHLAFETYKDSTRCRKELEAIGAAEKARKRGNELERDAARAEITSTVQGAGASAGLETLLHEYAEKLKAHAHICGGLVTGNQLRDGVFNGHHLTKYIAYNGKASKPDSDPTKADMHQAGLDYAVREGFLVTEGRRFRAA